MRATCSTSGTIRKPTAPWAVMVAVLFFYFSGLAILLGAQLNATIDRASQPIEPATLKAA